MKLIINENAREVLLKKMITPKNFLRLMVVEGGCAGMTYDAEIGSTIKDNESIIFQEGDIRIVSDKESCQYLDGLIIDYSDDLVAGGLRFSNSKSKSTCGCGASFSLSGFPVKSDTSCAR